MADLEMMVDFTHTGDIGNFFELPQAIHINLDTFRVLQLSAKQVLQQAVLLQVRISVAVVVFFHGTFYHFSHMSMQTRTCCAALDHNCNTDREQVGSLF